MVAMSLLRSLPLHEWCSRGSSLTVVFDSRRCCKLSTVHTHGVTNQAPLPFQESFRPSGVFALQVYVQIRLLALLLGSP